MAEAYEGFQPQQDQHARPRAAGETAEAFARRVALLYQGYARANGKPLKSIADALGVSKGTAGNWVTSARKRGYLPPTTRGRVS